MQWVEKAARKRYPLYECGIRPPERYLMERFITAPVWFDGDIQGDTSG
ncbi:hypothetical protein WDV93_01780 [Pantoea ananatis]